MAFIGRLGTQDIVVPAGQSVAVGCYGDGSAKVFYGYASGGVLPTYTQQSTVTNGQATFGPFSTQQFVRLEAPAGASVEYVIGATPQLTQFLNVNIGGGTATLASLNITGIAQFANGTASAPSISFVSVPNTGIFTRVSGYLMTSVNGVELGYWGPLAAGGNLAVSQGIGLAGGTTSTNAADAFLMRDAANTLAQRNGTAAQTFNLYLSYTDSANYSLGSASFNFPGRAGDFILGTNAAGTGTAAQLGLATGGIARWAVIAGGSFVPYSDNSYDLGASNGRVRNGYFSGALNVGAAALVVPTGSVSIGATTTTTVGAAGAAAALPTAPTGYLVINVGGTTQRVPYYN